MVRQSRWGRMIMTWPEDFLCIPESAADAAAVNPKGIKTLLANNLITFLLAILFYNNLWGIV